MDGCTALQPESRRKLEQTFDKLVEYFTPSRLVREVKSEGAPAWRAWMEERKLSLATVKTHVGNARTIFAKAVKAKLIEQSPFADERGGSTPSDSLTFVPWEDVERVLRKIQNPDLRLRVALCRYAGLRVDSEPPRLRWAKHVQLDERRLLLPCKKTERYAGKRFRVVPIDGRLMPHLALRSALRLAGEDRVCCIGRLTGSHKATVERAIKRAGVKRWPKLFQALRASYDSELRASGVHGDFAAKMTGHSAEVARRHYTAIPEALLDRVASLYSPEQVRQAAQNPAHCGAEASGTNGNGANGKASKASEIQYFPAVAGAAWNGGEMGDEGLEPPTSRV